MSYSVITLTNFGVLQVKPQYFTLQLPTVYCCTFFLFFFFLIEKQICLQHEKFLYLRKLIYYNWYNRREVMTWVEEIAERIGGCVCVAVTGKINFCFSLWYVKSHKNALQSKCIQCPRLAWKSTTEMLLASSFPLPAQVSNVCYFLINYSRANIT